MKQLLKYINKNMQQQTTSHLMMVRPANFGFNEQTAVNNAFQIKEGDLSNKNIHIKAVAEFDALVALLRAAGVNVMVIEDTPIPKKPDAIFPNNWITTHDNGMIITYPMFAPSRRLERRTDIIDTLSKSYKINKHLQLEKFESEKRFLEGTGSIIMDRPHQIAYACASDRTDLNLLNEFCDDLDVQAIVFHAFDEEGIPIYHTNVMMAIATKFVIICMDSITNPQERALLEATFKKTNKEIIGITHDQMKSFAGNMLEVRNDNDDTMLVMSEKAFFSLSDYQIERISQYSDILYCPIPTIEHYGGGGVRCMMAEIFLEEKEIHKVNRQQSSRRKTAQKTIIEKYTPEEGWIRIQ